MLARRVGLGEHLVLGFGADRSNERERPSLLAAAFEAVAGAIFLDGGLEAARAWIIASAAPELEAPVAASRFVSPKSRLQELSHLRAREAPAYRIVSAEGPDHAKHYVVEALVAGTVLGRGEGASRREAETWAAAAALEALAEDGR